MTPTNASWNGHNASGWKNDIIGINGLLLKENKNILDNNSLYSDINPFRKGFFNLNNKNNNNNNFYYLSNLNLFEVSYDPIKKTISSTNLAYVHYQKRKVRTSNTDDNLTLIYPYHWEIMNSLDECKTALIDNYSLDSALINSKFLYSFNRKFYKIMNLISESLNPHALKILNDKLFN